MKVVVRKKSNAAWERFNQLKENYTQNVIALVRLVEKTSKNNFDLAYKMFRTLVKENPYELHFTDDFTVYFPINMEPLRNDDRMIELLQKDEELKELIFCEAGSVMLLPIMVISHLTINGNFSFANELLELLFQNTFREETEYEILDQLIEDDAGGIEISEERFDFLYRWIGKIEDEDEAAQLKLKLFNLVEL